MADITKELKGFFEGLTKTLQDAITGDGETDEAKKVAEAKKAADEKEAADKAAAEAKAKAGEGNEDPPDLEKRVIELEKAITSEDEGSLLHSIKALATDLDATREALSNALDTVEKLVGGSAVKKSIDGGDGEDEPPTTEELQKRDAKDERDLGQAVTAAARGARVRIE